MGALSEILGKAKVKVPEPSSEDMEEDSSDDDAVSEEEVSAMRLFSKAASPEQKAEALKMFLKACGVY